MSCYAPNKVWLFLSNQCPTTCSVVPISARPFEGRSPLVPPLKNTSSGHSSTSCVLLPKLFLTVLMEITVLIQAQCPCFQNNQHFSSWNYGHFPCKLPLPAKLFKCPLLRFTWISWDGYMTFLRTWVHFISWVHVKKNMFKTRTGRSWPSQKKQWVKLVDLPY